jgi:FMN phosphatase YigB (HAD superfamily)
MSCLEILKHVLHLAFMVQQVVRNAPERARFDSDDPEKLRQKTLDVLEEVRNELLLLEDDTLATHEVLRRDGRRYPVWNIMNGPLADALTHVGQINAWRRLSGNPTPPVDVFEGVPNQ